MNDADKMNALFEKVQKRKRQPSTAQEQLDMSTSSDKHLQIVAELNAWINQSKPKDSGHKALPKQTPDDLPF